MKRVCMKLWNKIHFFLWSVKMYFLVNHYCVKHRELLNQIKPYQNKYDGKRCFVIGNGPSLTAADLDKLAENNEYTFASNRIYKMYDKTNWRPTFFSVCDEKLFVDNLSSIERIEDSIKILPLDLAHHVKYSESYLYFARYPFKFFTKYPFFCDDLKKKFGEGNTITYHLLQLAVCMGFKEIYLLGCDFSYNIGVDSNGKIIKNSNQKNYPWEEDNKVYNLPNLQANLYAYMAAKKYADSNNVVIKNATRGGKLEVYDRVQFENLFERKVKQEELE